MANEITLASPDSASPYVSIRRKSDQYVYNLTLEVFEVWNDLNVDDYDIEMTSSGGDYWIADMPSDIIEGYYRLIFYNYATPSTPVVTDSVIATDDIYWDQVLTTSGGGSVILASYALCTLEAAKRFIGMDASDAAQDDLIKQIINGVSDRIRKYCNRDFHATDHTEYQYINSSVVITKHTPIISVTSISDSSGNDFTYGYTEDYDWDSSNGDAGIIFFSTKIRDKILITYRAGFEVIPADLCLLCSSLVQETLNISQNYTVQTGQNINGYKLVNAYQISANQYKQMDRFKDISIA